MARRQQTQDTLAQRLEELRRLRTGQGRTPPRTTTTPSRPTTTTTRPSTGPRTPTRPPTTGGGWSGRLPGESLLEGAGDTGRANFADLGKTLAMIPVGLATLGIDVGKTAVDLPTEAVRVLPGVEGDIFETGNRRALVDMPASIGRTVGRLFKASQQGTYVTPSGMVLTTGAPTPRQSVENPYVQAYREGRLPSTLIEDIGNVALVAGGTGAALRVAGRGARASAAATASRAVPPPSIGYGNVGLRLAAQNAPRPGLLTRTLARLPEPQIPRVTRGAENRLARAEARAEFGDRLIGRGQQLGQMGNRLDRATMYPVTAPIRGITNLTGRGYRSLLNRMPDPEAPTFSRPGALDLGRRAAQRLETGGTMRLFEDLGRRRVNAASQATGTMTNTVAGRAGFRGHTIEQLAQAEQRNAGFFLYKMGVDPDAFTPNLEGVQRAGRQAGAEDFLAKRRRGEEVTREEVRQLRLATRSPVRQLERTLGTKITAEAFEQARRFRRGEDADVLARLEAAYAEPQRLQSDVLESHPSGSGVDYERVDPADELQYLDPDVPEDQARIEQIEGMFRRQQELDALYAQYNVRPPDPYVRNLDPNAPMSVAQRGDEMLPPQFNTPLRRLLGREGNLLRDPRAAEAQQAVQAATGELRNLNLSLLRDTEQVAAARRLVEETKRGTPEDQAAAAALLEQAEQTRQGRITTTRPESSLLRRERSEALLRALDNDVRQQARMARELNQVARRMDALQRVAIAQPDRFRPAMKQAQALADNTKKAAQLLEAQGLRPAARMMRAEARSIPVSMAQMVDVAAKNGVKIEYVPGGRTRPGQASATSSKLSGLKMRESTQMDIVLSAQHGINIARTLEAMRHEAENWLAGSEQAVVAPRILGEDTVLRGPELEREMSKRGFSLARRTDKADLKEGGAWDEVTWVPTTMRNAYAAYFERGRPGLPKRIGDRVIYHWKRGQLGLSPRWLMGNATGNLLMAKVHGEVPWRKMPGLMRESVALNNALRGLDPESMSGLQRRLVGNKAIDNVTEKLQEWVQSGEYSRLAQVFSHQLRLNPELADFNLNRLMDQARQRVLQQGDWTDADMEAAISGAVTQHLNQFDGSTEAWWRHPIRNAINQSFNVNTFMDDTVRGMVYLDQLYKKGGPENVSPQVAEQALEHALKSIGNYTSMSNFERQYVRTVFPFWSWMRHITRASIRLPVEHPYRTAWQLHLSTVGVPDEYYDDSPYTAGALPLGEDRFMPMNWMNPWAGSVAANLWQTNQKDPISMAMGTVAENVSPLIEFPTEVALGQTFDAVAPGQFNRALTGTGRPTNDLGFDAESQSLLSALLGGNPAPLAYRSAFYNPITRLGRDTISELIGEQRTETGGPRMRDGEPVQSPYTPWTPWSRYSGIYFGPGALIYDTELDAERRLEAQQRAGARS